MDLDLQEGLVGDESESELEKVELASSLALTCRIVSRHVPVISHTVRSVVTRKG